MKVKLILICALLQLLIFNLKKTNAQCPPAPAVNISGNLACNEWDFEITNYNSNITYTYQTNPPNVCTFINQQSTSPGVIWNAGINFPVTLTVTQTCNNVNVATSVTVFPCNCPPTSPFIFNDIQTNIPGMPPAVGGVFTLTGATITVYGTLTINATTEFNNCNFLMAPGAVININNANADVYFIGCTLQAACGQMWQGVRIIGANTLKVNTTTIQDAVYGLEIQNLNNLAFAGNIFQNNYIGIYRAISLNNTLNGSGLAYFDNSTFIGTTTLLPPFHGQNPSPTTNSSLAGIFINNINDFAVNSKVANPNVFQNLPIGIAAFNGNLTVNNTNFNTIGYSTAYPASGVSSPNGSAIYCQASNTAPRTLNVGMTSAGLIPCGIINAQKGIVATAGMSVHAIGNTINRPAGNTTLSYGINIQNCRTRTIELRNNTISNCNQAIDIRSVPNCNITINASILSSNITSPSSNFSRTGIIINNGAKQSVTLALSNNQIQNFRLGIFLRGLKAFSIPNILQQPRLNIFNNSITFNPLNANVTAAERYYGLWIENVERADVNSNWPMKTNGAFNGNPLFFQGFHLTGTLNVTVRNSWVLQVGEAIHFENNCNFTHLRCNRIDGCQQGVALLNASITDQGSSTADMWDNQFVNMNNGQLRIAGNLSLSGSTQVNWYYSSTLGGGVFNINPYIPFPTFIGIDNSVDNSNSCSIPTDDNHERLMEIINDSITYEEYQDENHYMDAAMAYLMLCQDSLLRNSKPEYMSFYEENATGNLALIRQAMALADSNQLQGALDILAIINPDNQLQTDLIYTLIVEFNHQLSGIDYTSVEIEALTNIANKSAYYGGEAVYNARAMLGLEMLDPEITLRKLKTLTSVGVQSVANSLIIYPNPTNGILHINMIDNSSVFVYDISGRFVKEFLVQNGLINVSGIEKGTYMLSIRNSLDDIHHIINIY